MSYQYDDTDAHRLPFRDDEDLGCMYADVTHALGVLGDAVTRCRDEDVRCQEVYNALDRLRRQTRRHEAINGFRCSLHVRHPDERGMQLAHWLDGIRKELKRMDVY
jgi:hypothetical protein